mmetsp:Transcript_15341/g.38691  ORF Transcript_15341/g.38691 Transcript_15341/m.38691 type:complete len:242 (-) Transcript_15341:483-1208(-)
MRASRTFPSSSSSCAVRSSRRARPPKAPPAWTRIATSASRFACACSWTQPRSRRSPACCSTTAAPPFASSSSTSTPPPRPPPRTSRASSWPSLTLSSPSASSRPAASWEPMTSTLTTRPRSPWPRARTRLLTLPSSLRTCTSSPASPTRSTRRRKSRCTSMTLCSIFSSSTAPTRRSPISRSSSQPSATSSLSSARRATISARATTAASRPTSRCPAPRPARSSAPWCTIHQPAPRAPSST